MKNSIIVVLSLFCMGTSYAQEQSFFEVTWKVKELNTVFRNKNVTYYHKDSLTNVLDYSKVEFRFVANGTYNGVNNLGNSASGTYAIQEEKDSAVIDGKRFYLVALDAQNFITRGYSLQIADELGNTDTAYTFLKLYPEAKVTGRTSASGTQDFMLYPNPAIDVLTIERGTMTQEISEIRILNVYGQKVRSAQMKDQASLSIKINDLPEGFYFVEIIDSAGKLIASRKISKK